MHSGPLDSLNLNFFYLFEYCVQEGGGIMACLWRSENDPQESALFPPCGLQGLDSDNQAHQWCLYLLSPLPGLTGPQLWVPIVLEIEPRASYMLMEIF